MHRRDREYYREPFGTLATMPSTDKEIELKEVKYVACAVLNSLDLHLLTNESDMKLCLLN